MQFTLPFSPSGTMDSLPTELKCLIAFHLRNCDVNPHGPRDIKQFRLVNKAFSIAGAKYLLPEIYLTFQSHSFERLRTISEHPFFSQHVKQLHYEPDAYGNNDGRCPGWDKYSHSMGVFSNIMRSVEPAEAESKRAILVMERGLAKENKAEVAGIIDVLQKYGTYKAIRSDQESIRSQHDSYNFDLVTQAMARLPKLAEVTLNFEQGAVMQSNAFKRAYAGTIYLPRGDYGHISPYGTMQLRSVLFGAASAGTKLKSLGCGKIDWNFLRTDEEQMGKVKTAVKHLEYFRIMLYTGRDYRVTSEFAQCYMFLKRDHRMCELLSAMKDLKTLNLSIDESSGADLEYMVGTTFWATLRVFELGSIMVAEDTLIGFLKRHAGTLKELELNDITLYHGGWTSALPRIRIAVELEDFRAVGYWRTFFARPYELWIMDTSQNSPDFHDPAPSKHFKLGLAIRKYVLEGGNCPLLDLATYPMSDQSEMAALQSLRA